MVTVFQDGFLTFEPAPLPTIPWSAEPDRSGRRKTKSPRFRFSRDEIDGNEFRARPGSIEARTCSSRFSKSFRPQSCRAGDRASWRFIEFFIANIRNKNTRAAYAQAIGQFFVWSERRGIVELARVRPVVISAYIEEMQATHSPPTVKQHLAAIRMLFDWFVIGQVIEVNPASSVRGPKYMVKTGKTPVLKATRSPAPTRFDQDRFDCWST